MKYILNVYDNNKNYVYGNLVYDKEKAKRIFGEYFEYVTIFDIEINKDRSIHICFNSFLYHRKIKRSYFHNSLLANFI